MIFQLENVRYQYPRPLDEGEFVFDTLSLDIPAGATTVIAGRSGVGKSTLLYLLGLLWDQSPKCGHITYFAETPFRYAELSARDRAALRLERFGFVLQSGYLLPSLTCMENIALPLLLRGIRPNTVYQRVQQLAEQLDDSEGNLLTKRLNHRAYDVSGGERRRMSLLRALVHDPHVVLADEPFSNLHSRAARATVALLTNWRQNGGAGQLSSRQRTLLVVTHEIDIVYNDADFFVVFQPDGQVVKGGPIPREQVDAAGGAKQILRWIEGHGDDK